MFPLGDDNSQRRSLPVVTFVLIALIITAKLDRRSPTEKSW